MNNGLKSVNCLVVGIIVLLLCFLLPLGSAAQNKPVFLLSWRANSYAPIDFRGKVLPTIGTPIVASLEVINGGKLEDLSNQKVYWFWGEDLIENGDGLQKISFRPTEGGVKKLSVQVGGGGGNPDASVSIPVVEPEAVIVVPFPGVQFSEQKIQVLAKPYFFNVLDPANFQFSWEVNTQKPTNSEDPHILNISISKDTPSGSLFNVGLVVRNQYRTTEAASKIVGLTFIK